MRVSIRENDRGFNPRAFDCEVFIDNEAIKECFTADEELGEAHCFKADDAGNLILTADKKRVQEIIRKGVVRIVCPLGFINI